jgi:DNA-binding XRE family transcriptional regulator
MPTLKEIRQKYYISRKKLALAADVSESTIVRVEEGKKHVTDEVAAKIVVALSSVTGENFTVSDLDGINLYNPMRDRSYAVKKSEDNHAA